jgi:FkbM family methyltransferase
MHQLKMYENAFMLLDLLKRLVKYPFSAARDMRTMKCAVLSKDIAVVAGRDGLFLINRNDLYIGKSLELYGEYAGLEGKMLASLVRPGQTVIEVGANIGSHTVGLAKRVGPSGKVFAFEPQRACFALLQSQIALNQLHNVIAFNEGSGADEREFWLPRIDYSGRGNFGGVSLQRSGSGQQEKVKVRRLDDVFPDAPAHLIKIDVEGMEREVIEGARALIERGKPLLYVEHDRVEESAALISLIQDCGYRLWWHIPPLFNPGNFFDVDENKFGEFASFNMLCVHRSSRMNVEELVEIKSSTDRHPLAG